jgi:dihydrodipicolinate synthase/N-acetylneuraminate lyase
VLAAFLRGDLESAREEQHKVNAVVDIILDSSIGQPLPVSKAVYSFRGLAAGPPRLPLRALDDDAKARLRARLDAIGFFDWC